MSMSVKEFERRIEESPFGSFRGWSSPDNGTQSGLDSSTDSEDPWARFNSGDAPPQKSPNNRGGPFWIKRGGGPPMHDI